MALIELTGKYAVGEHRYAIVDDDMHAHLSQWKWKAKPNGSKNNIYAVPNAMRDGKCVTVRMHRVVLGLSAGDPRDTDPDNHNALDNRHLNLVATTRSKNILNARRVIVRCACQHRKATIEREVSAVAAGSAISCDACIKKHKGTRSKRTVHFTSCVQCEKPIVGRTTLRRFRSEACRCRARYARRGSLSIKGEPKGIAHPDVNLGLKF